MQVNRFVAALNSADPDRLIAFYRDTLGLTVVSDVGPGAFRISSPDYIDFIVEGHSELTGDTREPQRVLLNFFVDDLLAEQTRLEHADVEFIARAEAYPGFGLVSTFLDPDGNYCQLMELESD